MRSEVMRIQHELQNQKDKPMKQGSERNMQQSKLLEKVTPRHEVKIEKTSLRQITIP